MTDDIRPSLNRIHAALERLEAVERNLNADREGQVIFRNRVEATLSALDSIIGRVEAGDAH